MCLHRKPNISHRIRLLVDRLRVKAGHQRHLIRRLQGQVGKAKIRVTKEMVQGRELRRETGVRASAVEAEERAISRLQKLKPVKAGRL
jgi:hypothetical protein